MDGGLLYGGAEAPPGCGGLLPVKGSEVPLRLVQALLLDGISQSENKIKLEESLDLRTLI